jgi:hypothetical protein
MNAALFEIKNVFCEKKKLGDVLEALAGLLIEAPIAVPVLSAKTENGKVRSTLPAGSKGSAREQFMQYVLQQGYDSVNNKMAQKFLRSIGQSPIASGNLIFKLSQEGFLSKPKGVKGKGQSTDWLVNTTKGEK